MSKGMRLLLIGMVVALAIGAAKGVDILTSRAPVGLSNIHWQAEERSCQVSFQAQNRTLTPRTVIVFVTLYAPGPTEKGEKAGLRVCGSTAIRLRLKPLECETKRITIPTTQMAVECDVEVEPEAK